MIPSMLPVLVALAVVPASPRRFRGHVLLLKASDGFDDVKENIVNAITNRGLLTSG